MNVKGSPPDASPTGTAALRRGLLHRRGGRELVDPKVYPEMDRFWSDLSGVYAEQITRLAELGCTYLQLDDTSFATLCDPAHRASMAAIGADGERIHEVYIRSINEALARNNNLAQAALKVRRAQLVAAQAGSDQLPSLAVKGSSTASAKRDWRSRLRDSLSNGLAVLDCSGKSVHARAIIARFHGQTTQL